MASSPAPSSTVFPASSSPTAAPSGAPKASSAGLNAEQIVALFQLTLLFIIFFFATAQIPRAIARWNHSRGTRMQGWLLQPRKAVRQTRDIIRRSLHFGTGSPASVLPVAPSPQRQPTIKRSPIDHAARNPFDDGSDDNHGITDLAKQIARSGSKRSQRSTGPASAPIHVPAWTTLFHPVASRLVRPFFSTGLSIGQVTIYAIYTAMFIFVAFINAHGTDDINRAGWLVVAQTPLMVALGAKNSIVGLLVGRGYEKLNFIHRWIGKLMFIASVFHVVGYLVIWLQKDIAGREAAEHVVAWVAFAALGVVAITSLPFFRRSAYNLFFHAHWVGFTIMLIALCYHVPDALYWTLAAFFILGLDHVCRTIKSYYTTVNLQVLPELRMTRIEVPHLASGWRAGQHVRLRAISAKMGKFAFTEVHPFTISSVAEAEGGEGIVLYVKSCGDWTRKLYDAASQYEYGNEKAEKGMGNGATMKVVIEGPYGGGGHAMYSSFTSSFIVVGGSGITYGLSVVEELVRDIEDLRARTRLIQLVWIVQDPAALVPLLPTLTSFLDRVTYLPTVSLRLTIFYTRAVSPSSTSQLQLPRNAVLEAGRPDFPKLLRTFVTKTDGLSRGKTGLTGVVVGVCGPRALAEGVSAAERQIGRSLRKSVGGVELVEETFGW